MGSTIFTFFRKWEAHPKYGNKVNARSVRTLLESILFSCYIHKLATRMCIDHIY